MKSGEVESEASEERSAVGVVLCPGRARMVESSHSAACFAIVREISQSDRPWTRRVGRKARSAVGAWQCPVALAPPGKSSRILQKALRCRPLPSPTSPTQKFRLFYPPGLFLFFVV